VKCLNSFLELSLDPGLTSQYSLVPVFMVMAPLNNRQISPEKVKMVLHQIFDKIDAVHPRLIECVLMFLSMHPNYAIGREFNEYCLRIKGLSHIGHLALLRSIIAVEMPYYFYPRAAFAFLNLVLQLGIAFDYIRQQIPLLMKIPKEIFKISSQRGRAVRERSSLLFFVDESLLASKICEAMPSLVVKMSDWEVKDLLKIALGSNNRVISYLLLLAIARDAEASRRLPIDFDDHLAPALKLDNPIAVQIAAESICWHISHHPSRLSKLLERIKPDRSSSCFAEAAMVRILDLSDQVLLDLIFRAAKRLTNESLLNYVIHELTCLYEAKSKQLVRLGLGDQQCQFLLALLQVPRDLFSHFLIADCLEKFIAHLLPNLESEAQTKIVVLSLQTFYHLPLPFMKQRFYETFRSFVVSSPDFVQFFEINLPLSTTSPIDTRLACCGVLSDLSSVHPVKLEDLNQLTPFLVLLQRTNDKRVIDLLVAAALSDSLIQWFALTKQLLSSNMMPGFGDCQVEPNVTVKCCALKIIEKILPSVKESLFTETESLDDLMTSVIHAVEARRAELDQIAYGILKSTVNIFKDVLIDNTNPLAIYESQFSIAIRASFPSAIDAAAEFHVAYIEMFMANFEKDRVNCLGLLESYVKGLNSVIVRTSGYFAITSEICMLASKFDVVCETFRGFLSTLAPLFSAILFDSIRLRTTGSDLLRLATYRDRVSSFYHSLMSATVWLRKKFPAEDQVPLDSVVSFFLLELISASESWRLFAAFSALTTLLKCNAAEFSEMLPLALTSMCHAANQDAAAIGPLIPEFLDVATALRPRDAQLWTSLAFTALSHRCSAAVLGRILKFTELGLVKASMVQFADFVVAELDRRDITQDEAAALVTVLYDVEPGAIPAILPRLLGIERNVAFKLKAIERAYRRIETRSAIDVVSAFLVETLQPETMKVIGDIIIRRPAIGVEILRRGVARRAFSHRFELARGIVFFHFANLVFDQLADFESICRDGAKAVLRAFALDGNDRTSGEMMAVLTVAMVRKCDQRMPAASARAFVALASDARAEVNRLLQKYGTTKVVKKVSLVKFSAMARRKTDDEWQSLDMDD
jgi:hypothetical protein